MKLPFEKVRQLRLGLSGAVRAPSENKTSSKKELRQDRILVSVLKT